MAVFSIFHSKLSSGKIGKGFCLLVSFSFLICSIWLSFVIVCTSKKVGHCHWIENGKISDWFYRSIPLSNTNDRTMFQSKHRTFHWNLKQKKTVDRTSWAHYFWISLQLLFSSTQFFWHHYTHTHKKRQREWVRERKNIIFH